MNNRQDNQPLWLNWTREERLYYRPSKMFIRADGKYLLLFSDEGVGAVDNVNGRTYEVSIYDPKSDEFQHDILSFEWTGQVLIHEIGDGFMTIFGVPYRRDSLFDYSDGQFVLGWTEEMLFRFYDANGQYQKAYNYTYSNTNLYLDDVLKFYEDAGDDLIDAIRSDEQPDTWPAFHSLTLDDENQLWVSTISDDLDNFEWWILNEQGHLITTLYWPHNHDLKVAKNGYAYTMERDLATHEQEVVRYKINLELLKNVR